MTTREKLHRLVKALRKNNMKDNAIATYIGVDKGTFSRWMDGTSEPGVLAATGAKIDAACKRAGVAV